jgi:GntR family transcriptional regulator of vanillate catabolism
MSASRLEVVTLALRDLILSGQLKAGSKITELGMADRLGVSRTPVRLALQALEGEGLVSSEPNRGFTVKAITRHDVSSGFDVRGALEGLACRLVAEVGMRRHEEAALRQCVDRGDFILVAETLDEVTVRTWTDVNREFHRIIMEAAENAPLIAAHELVCRNPLVGPGSLAFSPARLKEDTTIIADSQRQHRSIWEALCAGQGARADYLAREHIHQAKLNTIRHLQRQPAGVEMADERGP